MAVTSDHVMALILERARQGPARTNPVVVFDIDATLIETSHRHLAVLDDFLVHVQAGEQVIEAARTLHRQGVGWSVVDDLCRAGVTDPGVLESLTRFWTERFFSAAYMRRDLPIPGAPAFVQACHRAGVWCHYLTARVRAEAEAVTLHTLRRFGFPTGSRTTLQMKPDPHLDDHAFKQAAMAQLPALGDLVAAFDNDPANINAFHARFPSAVCVLVDTVHAPDAPSPAEGVLVLRAFTSPSLRRWQHNG